MLLPVILLITCSLLHILFQWLDYAKSKKRWPRFIGNTAYGLGALLAGTAFIGSFTAWVEKLGLEADRDSFLYSLSSNVVMISIGGAALYFLISFFVYVVYLHVNRSK